IGRWSLPVLSLSPPFPAFPPAAPSVHRPDSSARDSAAGPASAAAGAAVAAIPPARRGCAMDETGPSSPRPYNPTAEPERRWAAGRMAEPAPVRCAPRATPLPALSRPGIRSVTGGGHLVQQFLQLGLRLRAGFRLQHPLLARFQFAGGVLHESFLAGNGSRDLAQPRQALLRHRRRFGGRHHSRRPVGQHDVTEKQDRGDARDPENGGLAVERSETHLPFLRLVRIWNESPLACGVDIRISVFSKNPDASRIFNSGAVCGAAPVMRTESRAMSMLLLQAGGSSRCVNSLSASRSIRVCLRNSSSSCARARVRSVSLSSQSARLCSGSNRAIWAPICLRYCFSLQEA